VAYTQEEQHMRDDTPYPPDSFVCTVSLASYAGDLYVRLFTLSKSNTEYVIFLQSIPYIFIIVNNT
jgi:hypothetical protein